MSHFQSTGHSITYANQLAYMLFHARPRSAQIAAAGRTVRGPIAGVIVEHNLDLVLALAGRVFALERGAVFHRGPAKPLLDDLNYRKKILWI